MHGLHSHSLHHIPITFADNSAFNNSAPILMKVIGDIAAIVAVRFHNIFHHNFNFYQLIKVNKKFKSTNKYYHSIWYSIASTPYYKTKKSPSLRYFDTCFMHNIGRVSDRRRHDYDDIGKESCHRLSETPPILFIKHVSMSK